MSFNLQFCQALLKGEVHEKAEEEDSLWGDTQELPGQLSKTSFEFEQVFEFINTQFDLFCVSFRDPTQDPEEEDWTSRPRL